MDAARKKMKGEKEAGMFYLRSIISHKKKGER